MSLRASPLKIPQGALPLDPTTFEKVDKTFNCHSYTMGISFQPHRWKSFCQTFFKKFVGLLRATPLTQGCGGEATAYKGFLEIFELCRGYADGVAFVLSTMTMLRLFSSI